MRWSARLAVSVRAGEMAAGALLLLFACAIVWGSFQMSAGTAGAPGPGYFPRALGVLLVLVSVALLIRALRLVRAADEAVTLGHRDIALTVAALAVLGLLFEPAGYVLSASLFMFVLLRAFSTLGWVRSLVAAVATALATYYLFVKLLGVTLPAGPLSFL